MKYNDLYYSIENQKTFEKMLEESQKESKGLSSNSYGVKGNGNAKYQDQNESMDNKYYQTNSQSSVTDILKKAR